MAELTIVEAIRSAILMEMQRDERVMVLGLDVGRLGGVFRSTDGLIERFGRKRVFDTPLAEASIIGSAIGLAISGLVPIAEIQFLGFSAQAFHQMGSQLGRFRYRSRGRYPLQVTVRAPMGGGTRTPEFHADALEALFVQTPALKIVMPSNPYDAKGLLIQAIRDPDPVLFIEPERLYRKGRVEVPDDDYTVPFGKASIVRAGTDVTIIAWSAAVETCERAAAQLAEEGISSEVIDLRTIVPLDTETMTQSVIRTGRAVVVHEAVLTAGFGAEVAATLQEECFSSLDAPILRVAGYDTPYPPASMEDAWLPSAERIVAAVRRILGVETPIHQRSD
jgi:pyruvate dehydrogenase E1 component beta subunit